MKDIAKIIEQILTSTERLINSMKSLFAKIKKPKRVSKQIV